MTEETRKQTQPKTPFQKFETFAKRLLAVPKKELNEKLEEFKERQRKKREGT